MATATAIRNDEEGAASVAPDLQIYRDLQRMIATSDVEAIRGRWMFGRELLTERIGEMLPRGRLAEVATVIGKSKAEVGRRMMFAERFPSEEALSHAVRKYGSWRAITTKGFADTAPKKSRSTNPKPKQKATYGGKRLRNLHAEKRAGGEQTDVWKLQIAISQANQLLERFEIVGLKWDEHGDVAERLQWIYDDVATMVRFGEQALDVITATMDDLGLQRKLDALRIRMEDQSSTPFERENAAVLAKRIEQKMARRLERAHP